MDKQTHPTYKAWRNAGAPKPYVYHGPKPSNPWALQAAVVAMAVGAVYLLDSILSLSGPGLLVLYARWHPMPAVALAAGIAAGAGTTIGAALWRYHLIRSALRNLRLAVSRLKSHSRTRTKKPRSKVTSTGPAHTPPAFLSELPQTQKTSTARNLTCGVRRYNRIGASDGYD